MDRMKIVFNDVPLFLAKKIKELVVRNNFNCKIDGNVYEIKGEFGPFTGFVYILVQQPVFTLNVKEWLYYDEAKPTKDQDLVLSAKKHNMWFEKENFYTWKQ